MLEEMNEEQIEEYFLQVFTNQKNHYGARNIHIRGNTVVFSQEYKYIEFNQSHLFKLCLLFGTDNIVVDKYDTRGCMSCDMGSSYTVEFRINKPTKEWESMKQTMKEFVELQNKKEQ